MSNQRVRRPSQFYGDFVITDYGKRKLNSDRRPLRQLEPPRKPRTTNYEASEQAQFEPPDQQEPDDRLADAAVVGESQPLLRPVEIDHLPVEQPFDEHPLEENLPSAPEESHRSRCTFCPLLLKLLKLY